MLADSTLTTAAAVVLFVAGVLGLVATTAKLGYDYRAEKRAQAAEERARAAEALRRREKEAGEPHVQAFTEAQMRAEIEAQRRDTERLASVSFRSIGLYTALAWLSALVLLVAVVVLFF